jgi:hypothetical protein
MDELVKNTAIVDGALVKAVTALMPGESIERILDVTREVNLKRVFDCIKARGYETVIHLVGELKAGGLTEGDARVVLAWLAQEDPGAKTLLDSDLVISIFKFISDLKPSNQRAWCCTRPKAL